MTNTARRVAVFFLYSYFMRKCNGRLVFLPLFNFNLIVFARICFMFICAHTEQYKRLLFIQVPGLVCFCYFNFGIVSAHSKLGSESDCMGGWTSFGFSRPNEWVESLFFCVRKKNTREKDFCLILLKFQLRALPCCNSMLFHAKIPHAGLFFLTTGPINPLFDFWLNPTGGDVVVAINRNILHTPAYTEQRMQKLFIYFHCSTSRWWWWWVGA